MKKIKIYNLDKLNCKHEDDRGWIVSIVEFATKQGQKIENIHIGSINPSEVRGNHLHKRQIEWIFVFGGKGIFSWREGNKIKKQKLDKNKYFLFEVGFGCSHAIKNIDEQNIYVCAFTNQKYNRKKPDVILDKIL